MYLELLSKIQKHFFQKKQTKKKKKNKKKTKKKKIGDQHQCSSQIHVPVCWRMLTYIDEIESNCLRGYKGPASYITNDSVLIDRIIIIHMPWQFRSSIFSSIFTMIL